MNYFEYQEARTQRSVSIDVIDWPGITVTEGELSDDQLLELSLMSQQSSIGSEGQKR